jgi:hypothetical protein
MYKPFSFCKSDPLTQLYFSLSIILLCGPLHKLCFRVLHFVPFALGVLSFYAILLFLLRFSEVKRWYKAVLFAVFNNLLFQRYLRMCMRTENFLSSNKRGTRLGCFLFSFSATSVYLGQFMHEPYLLPVFIDALTFILIVVYFQLRSSVLFELPAAATPLSWSSTLAMFTRQLGLESPLQNRLVVDESYESMLPRLDILYVWKYLREALLRPWRSSGLPTAPVPPLPPGAGGAAQGSSEGIFTGLVGVTSAAVGSGVVTLAVHSYDYEQKERHHQNDVRLREGDLFKDLAKDYRNVIQAEEFKLKSLANARSREAISERAKCEEAIKLYKEKLRATESKLDSLYSSTPSASEGFASAVPGKTPPAVYSCFEPPVISSVTLEAECITHASYFASLEPFLGLIV